jgi:GNAT superfamily N-acetyltransferase
MPRGSDVNMLAMIRERYSTLLRQRRGSPGGSRGPGLKADERPAGPGEQRANGLVVSDVDNGLYERLDQEMFAFNVAATGHREVRPVRIAVRGDDGDLLGGLCGWTWGGCGYVDLLWVRADHRDGGLGSRLLAAAEEEIRRRGCDQVGLSTYSFQALGFYLRAGYQECGRRSDYPRGHEQIQLVKRLS